MKRPYAVWTWHAADMSSPHVRPGRFGSLHSAQAAALGHFDFDGVRKVEVRELLGDRWQQVFLATNGGSVRLHIEPAATPEGLAAIKSARERLKPTEEDA